MKNLNDDDLNQVNGGLVKLAGAGIGLAIGAAVTFIIGVFSGYVRPYACNSGK